MLFASRAASLVGRSAAGLGSSMRSNAVSTIQQRGARATPPLRRHVQQPPSQHASALSNAVKNISRSVWQPRRRSRARVVRVIRIKDGSAKMEPKPLTPAEEAAIAASERTHAANSRLGLTKNALGLRFSNENSYLNWARNGVLASAVGVAMYAQEHHRGAQLSGAGLLLLGFGYIGVGTAKYVYYILRFRNVMELSWWSVIGTSSHASAALIIWLTATASFLESVPLELDAMLLTEPIIDYLPFRIRQGLIETYSLYLDDLEHHTDEQERVLRAIRGEQYEPRGVVPPPMTVAPVLPPVVDSTS